MTSPPETQAGEDSRNEPVAYKSPRDRALEWADDIRTRPLDDEQAIQLAQVYASLAAVEQQERTAAALEALRQPLEQFLAYMGLSGSVSPPPEAVSEHEGPTAGRKEHHQ